MAKIRLTSLTPKQLAEWILTLPENIQNGLVTSVVHGGLHDLKRVVAFEQGDEAGIYAEPMGTHADHVEGRTYPCYIDYQGNTLNCANSDEGPVREYFEKTDEE